MTRRTVLAGAAAGVVAWTLGAGASAAKEAGAGGRPALVRVYIGTYTGPKSKGIHLATLDLRDGRLSEPQLAAEATNPSFLAIHPSKKFLYAVGETYGGRGRQGGTLSAFAIDPASGKLTPLNQRPSGGQGPCHVTVDPSGRAALVANYGSGSVASFPIADDGRLGEAASVIQHEGSSVDPQRQKGPHAHSVNLSPDGRLALVADLGLDKVLLYDLDPTRATIAPHDPPFARVAPGAGPRHLAFHPSGRWAYVINEMASTITAFAYDAARGSLAEVQTISTLPTDFKGNSSTAEVAVHPSGRFVYGSNRGHDSIAVFAVDEATGKLASRGHAGTRGKTPRNFAIEPTGSHLVAGNQGSDSVVVFRIDGQTGALTPVGKPVTVGAPVCFRFVVP